MGIWFNQHGNLTSFKFLAEAAPLVAANYSRDWARWRDKHDLHGQAILDAAAAGPKLIGDELVKAVFAKYPGTGWRDFSVVSSETENVATAAQ